MTDTTGSEDLCVCPTAKSQTLIKATKNTCPTCAKPMIETEGQTENLNDKTKLADLLGNLTEVQAALSSVKNRQHDAVKLKQPSFSGKTDPKHSPVVHIHCIILQNTL